LDLIDAAVFNVEILPVEEGLPRRIFQQEVPQPDRVA
jgi:hypothetical protein